MHYNDLGVHLILEKSTINLKTCLFIMQAYILLCPELYLQKSGRETIQMCQYLMSDIRTEGIVMICKLYITMMRVQPDYSVELLHSVMVDVMRNLLGDSDYLSIKQIYLQLSIRYFLANQHAFSRILEEVQVEDALQKFLTIWFNTMPGVTQNEDKKLLAIALCSLLTVPNAKILESFSTIIILVYETLCDIMKQEEEDGEEIDSLILTDANFDMDSTGMYDVLEDDYKTPHYERLRGMCMKDPVHVVVLKDYLQTQVSFVELSCELCFNDSISVDCIEETGW